MKTIKELRSVLRFHPQEINSSIGFFAEKCNIDFDVYLKGFMFPYYIVNEDYGNKFTDEDKINWFRYLKLRLDLFTGRQK